MKVAIVGGTGDFGLALAARLVEAGDEVVIGSRDAERAQEKANEVGCRGARNEAAVGGVELAVLATVADAALETAQALRSFFTLARPLGRQRARVLRTACTTAG